MKKQMRMVFVMIALAVSTPAVYAASPTSTVSGPAEQRANQLKERLEEIHKLDPKTMSRKEKRALRGEVKAIKKEMADISGGVYLSVGAIILIVLLIILLA